MNDFESIQAAAQQAMQAAPPEADTSARGPTASAGGAQGASAVATPASAPAPGQVMEVTVGPDGMMHESGGDKTAPFTPVQAGPAVLLPTAENTPPAPAAPPQAAPPAAAPPPPAAPSAPAPAATPPAAAPEVVDPAALARNFRIQAQSHVDQLALHLVKQDPSKGLLAATVEAHQQLGMGLPASLLATPAPSTPPASPAQPAAPAAPVLSQDQTRLQQINERLDQIDADSASLDAIVDSSRLAELTRESNRLQRELATVSARVEASQLLAAQQAQQTAAHSVDAHIEANLRECIATYPELAQDDSPMAVQYDAAIARLQNTNDPLLQSPRCEQLVAAQVAQQLGLLPASMRPQAATPPSAVGTPTPASPPPAAPAPGLAPVAVPPAIPGHVGTLPSDRVSHVQPAPDQAIQALNTQYLEAVQRGDFEQISALSQQAMRLGAGSALPAGSTPPPPPAHRSLSLVV